MEKKYIIELEDEPFIQHFKNGAWETIYRVKGFNSLVFDWNSLQMLTPYTEPDMEQVRKDVWVAARKIAVNVDHGGLSAEALREIFTVGTASIARIFDNFSASEAIEKIRQYEQEQEEQIQVGDEIEAIAGKAVVVYVDEHKVRYVYSNGVYAFECIDNVTKTGRHFPEIAEVLRKMKETE